LASCGWARRRGACTVSRLGPSIIEGQPNSGVNPTSASANGLQRSRVTPVLGELPDQRCGVAAPTYGRTSVRLKLSDSQELARTQALQAFEHPISAIGALARAKDCLPVFVDWTAFLGVGRGGACLWVNHDETPGKIAPVEDLLDLSILVSHAAQVKGLEGLLPARPGGRADCEKCGGCGVIKFTDGIRVEAGCFCGGLGWRAASAGELGIEAA
jgi:hypothetical protein